VIDPTQYELWFVTGSQHLYGDQTLASVEADARAIATALGSSQDVPLSIVSQPVMTGPDQIDALARAANADPRCAGVIAWMHTFSPARMWLGFLDELRVPLLHLHTQFARDLPWSTIDMDYMNCHQSAHGDREFGYLATRLRHRREVVAGHWGESG
jgi:L-arabinose isomerase